MIPLLAAGRSGQIPVPAVGTTVSSPSMFAAPPGLTCVTPVECSGAIIVRTTPGRSTSNDCHLHTSCVGSEALSRLKCQPATRRNSNQQYPVISLSKFRLPRRPCKQTPLDLPEA